MVSRLSDGGRRLTTHRRLLRPAVLAAVCLLGAAPAGAQPAIRQVLVLQSFARGNLVLDHFAGNFRVDLEERLGSFVNVVEIVVAPSGFAVASEQAVVDYIRSTFANRPTPDLIMTIAGPASVFARKYRQQLFPDSPILFAAVDERFLAGAPLSDSEAAVAVANDFSRLVDDMLQLLPQTRQVFMVVGSGSIGTFWHRELERDFSRFRDRLEFVWTDDLSLVEILRRSASLSEGSAIFYLTFGTDAAGGTYSDARVLADLYSAANAPLFAGLDVYIGHGVVGGTMMGIDDLARSTAGVAIRLLSGASPGSVRLPPQPPGRPVFDWRQLQRWGIDESRLPPGSVVRFKAPSLWHEYRLTAFVAAAVLMFQSLLIAGLLYQRRARQRAELDSRKNLALAADASRRQTMAALTSSITHDLGQPLSSMIHNARAPDDDRRWSRDAQDHRRGPGRHPGAGGPGHADHRSAPDHAAEA